MASEFLSQILAGQVNLQEFGGWRHYARPGSFAPVGIVIHHTAGRNDLNTVINGRPGLAGPLANLYFDRDAPHRVTLVSGGLCNHAGPGSAVVLDEVRRGVASGPGAGLRRLDDDASGNRWFYGFEAENLGDGVQPWPPEQYRAMVAAAAAICRHHRWGAGVVIGHLEWTRRKIDPRGLSMAGFRADVARLLDPSHVDARPIASAAVSGPSFEEDTMQRHFVSLHAGGARLDGAGNGYWDLPQFDPDRVVTISPNVANPPEAGYNVPDVGWLRWGEGIRVVVQGGVAGGGLDVSVWTVG